MQEPRSWVLSNKPTSYLSYCLPVEMDESAAEFMPLCQSMACNVMVEMFLRDNPDRSLFCGILRLDET